MLQANLVLAPGASEVELGVAALAPLPEIALQAPGGHFLCASIVPDSHWLGLEDQFSRKSITLYISLGGPRRPPWQPKALQSGSRAAQRNPNETQ